MRGWTYVLTIPSSLLYLSGSVCCSAFPTYPIINTVQSVNGVPLVVTRQRRPMIGNAHITKCDIVLKNGLIFEVNDIIEFKAQAQRTNYFK